MTTLAKTDLAGVLAHLSAEDARYHAWQFGQTWLDEHGPNLALDAFGYAVDERHKLGIEAASVQEVYDAAKLVFAAQPGKNFTCRRCPARRDQIEHGSAVLREPDRRSPAV
ncbi:hypothetical protein [Cupriavidus metallidurans]|uniref:hypothetical protein n=1 Tax=Cupriavidus metallidurans TaxID=119219 RepID=UPI001F224D9F|nr:hypothetical protein [Cupriavidus metallidurans]